MMWNPNYMDGNALHSTGQEISSSQMPSCRFPFIVSSPGISFNSQNTEIPNTVVTHPVIDDQVNLFLYQQQTEKNQLTRPQNHYLTDCLPIPSVANVRPAFPIVENQSEVHSTKNIQFKKQSVLEIINYLKLKLRRQKKTIGDLNGKLVQLSKLRDNELRQQSKKAHRDPCEMIENWGRHLSQMQRITNEENKKKFAQLESLLEKDRRERMEWKNPFSNWRCSICLESDVTTSGHQLASLPCGHIFGLRCILKSLEASKRCPQCRKSFNNFGLRYVYPN